MAFEFKFADKFPNLIQANFEEAYEEVNTMFVGVNSLWAVLTESVRDEKRELCINYLVGWYLADLYPLEVQGIAGGGGMPISSKNIGGTSINYSEIPVQEGLKQLTSNAFGLKALAMIQACPERFGVFG